MRKTVGMGVIAACIVSLGCVINKEHQTIPPLAQDLRHIAKQARQVLGYVEGKTDTLPGMAEAPQPVSRLNHFLNTIAPVQCASLGATGEARGQHTPPECSARPPSATRAPRVQHATPERCGRRKGGAAKAVRCPRDPAVPKPSKQAIAPRDPTGATGPTRSDRPDRTDASRPTR